MGLYHLRVFVALSLVFGQLCPSDCKLCCEPECTKPISYGRTQQRHTTRDVGFLSYPASAIVTVLVKGAYFGENGEEFWEAEIMGKHGLIRSTAINEMAYKCQPQDFCAKEDKGKVEDGLHGADTFSHETDHQSNSDQFSPMTEQDLVSSSRPVDDQLDVTQLPTQNQDDRFDTPTSEEDDEGMHADVQEQPVINKMGYKCQPLDLVAKEDKRKVKDGLSTSSRAGSGWEYTAELGWIYCARSEVDDLDNPKTDRDLSSFLENEATKVTKPVEPDQQGTHDGELESDVPKTSQWFNSDQYQQASKEHKNVRQPPTGTPHSKSGHVRIGSKRDPNLLGIDMYGIYLRSIGLQPSHLHPSPPVTQLPGGGGERPNVNIDSEKDDHVEQGYSTSQLRSEKEQKQELEKDVSDVITDGTHSPDNDVKAIDDFSHMLLLQSPAFTQSFASTRISSSDSTDVETGHNTNLTGSEDDVCSLHDSTEDEVPLSEAGTPLSASAEDKIPPTEGEAPPPEARPSHSDDKTAPSEADTEANPSRPPPNTTVAGPEAPPTGLETPPPIRHDETHDKDDRYLEAPPIAKPVDEIPNTETDQSPSEFDDSAMPLSPYGNVYDSEEGGAPGEDTPTPPVVDTGSAFEELSSPPRMDYRCRNDYLPMPGNYDEGWMAYHEQVRGHIQDSVLNSLPRESSDFVCHSRPMMAMIVTSIVYFSLFVMIWYRSGRSDKQKWREIQIKLANYRKLEEDLSSTQNDKSVLEQKLRECEDRYQDLQDKTKQEIERLQDQMAAVVSERAGALEQATQLSASIQELEQKVQGLEAQKDQLKEDSFTAQTALQELQSQHEQVTAELEETKEQCEGLKNELSSLTVQPSVVRRLKSAVSFWSSCKRNTKVEN